MSGPSSFWDEKPEKPPQRRPVDGKKRAVKVSRPARAPEESPLEKGEASWWTQAKAVHSVNTPPIGDVPKPAPAPDTPLRRPRFARRAGATTATLSEHQALILTLLVHRGGKPHERIPWAAKEFAPGLSCSAASVSLERLEARGYLVRERGRRRTMAVELTELGHREGATRVRTWLAALRYFAPPNTG